MKTNKDGERSRLARLVEKRIDELVSVKSQRDIAREAGYKNQNMITMIKQGTTKVSIERAAPLAKALETDPKEFLLLVLEQTYSTDLIAEMMKTLGVRNFRSTLDSADDENNGEDVLTH